MTAMIFRPRLNLNETQNVVEEMKRFFRVNPRRRVCWVGDDAGRWFRVRRAHILDDVLPHSEVQHA